jgi:DNA-binding transcriptional MerR regulator
MSDRLLTIGKLAHRTGVATSALRYYEDVGLLPPPVRVSGQRRYPESAVRQVGMILLLRDVGFSLAEERAFIGSLQGGHDDRRCLAQRKLAELDEQIARAQTARGAIKHALRCPRKDFVKCPKFTSLIDARLAGQRLAEAHPH